jgi:putative transposase
MIRSIFTGAVTQICVVMLRGTWCGRTKKMKAIYNAPNKDAARMELEQFEQKWGSKYPMPSISLLEYPLAIRRILTTNIIENLNSKIRKYTKKQDLFP